MKKLSKLIRLARKKKSNMPMVTVAEKVGIGYGVMQKIESGTMKTYPDKELLLKICEPLDIPYEDAVDYIYDYKKRIKDNPNIVGVQSVPVISWKNLDLVKKRTPLSDMETIGGTVCRYESKDLFGVQMPDDLFCSLARNGDVLVVELSSYFNNLDHILFYNEESKQFEIRIAETTKKGTLLKSMLETVPTEFVTYKNKSNILGVIVEVVKRLKQ